MSRHHLPIKQARDLVALAEARDMMAQSAFARLRAQQTELREAVASLRRAEPDAEASLNGQALTRWHIWRERELIRLQESLAIVEIDLLAARDVAVRRAAELAVCERLRDEAISATQVERMRAR